MIVVINLLIDVHSQMLSLSRYSICLLLTSCLLACGCSRAKDTGKAVGELANVHAELIKKFGDKDINLRVDGIENRTNISVAYINSPLNEKTAEDRAKRAQETAQIVKRHYRPIKTVSEIWVGFMRRTTRAVIFHRSEVLEAYGFDHEARALVEPRTAPVDASQPTVRYMANQNQTDIGGSVRLEGTEEKGVTLFPHFTVAGDTNKIKPKPPAEVSLDFASYSDKPKFPDITKIVFLSDNQVAYQTEGQFSTSKIAGDMYSEFLYLKAPAAAFRKITSGKTIKIRLNEREYTLTETAVLQMQRMSDYLR